MGFFQTSVTNKYLKASDKQAILAAYSRFKDHFHNPVIQENIRNSKEEQYQGEFLIDLFVNVLGYTKNPTPGFNLTTEYKNVKDSKKADGAIIIKDIVKAVIELKGTETTDLGKIENQAFGYKNNQPECLYVIISNFEKLRFYIDNAIEFIEFNLFTLNETEFELLFLCLGYENIEKDIPKKIKEESLSQEDQITKQLYNDYSLFKRELHQNLVTLNPQFDPLTLFKKSQKLLDRFLFLFFAEDRLLLPPNSVRLILDDWRDLQEREVEIPLYSRYKKYFEYLNTGFKGKRYDVFAYNGGLFKPDEILDVLKIDDELLFNHTLKLSDYDFASEVDVNILGHIFENSLNEIDEIAAQLEGQEIDKTKSKRKKDGVFYTPKYITKYIVDNTIGKLCNEKKTELQIFEDVYSSDKKRQKKTTQALAEKLTEYRNWLLQLTICDPACGSGAFLNQALNFLIVEHRYIDELQAKLFGDAMVLSDIEKSILENNLFGVDLNEESVEIAKLSLWLRTAQLNRKLNDLNNNIKCGNSLIDDPDIAGEKAFNWKEAFPKIFEKGGFDVVIGNPPYIPTEYINETDKVFLSKTYDSAFGRINLYPIFFEKGIDLLKEKGLLGFITPYTILKNQYYKEARRYILDNSRVIELIDFKGATVFQDAAVDSIILILKKELVKQYVFKQISEIISFETTRYKEDYYNISEVLENEDLSMLISSNEKLIKKIVKNAIPLKKILNFNQGVITGDNKKYLTTVPSDLTKYVITGSDFNRYRLNRSNQLLIYDVTKLHRPRKKEIFEVPEKILLRQTGAYPVCMLDQEQFYTLDTVHNGLLIDSDYSIRYLLALLNSKFLKFLYQSQINEEGKVFAQVKIIYIDPLPIQKLTLPQQLPFDQRVNLLISLNKDLQTVSAKFQRSLQRKFELGDLPKKLQEWYLLSYAEFIIELSKKKTKLTLQQEAEWEGYFLQESKEAKDIKTKIEAIDKEIDQMVYELYGLTEEEIKMVENLLPCD